MKKSRVSQSGRSMIEMLGVIAIIGVLTVGSIATVSYVDNYFRTTSTALEIDKQANEIADLYSWRVGFPETNTLQRMVCKEDIFVCEKDKNSDTYKTPTNIWGGDIRVETIDSGNTFTITYTGVPQVACERLFDAYDDNAFRYVKLADDTKTSSALLCPDDNNDIEFEYLH